MPRRTAPLRSKGFRWAVVDGEVGPVRRIRPRSKRRARQEREYGPERDAFLAEHPYCQFPGCGAPATELHHARGREGPRLRRQADWRAACREHNDFAETHTGEALVLGWLLSQHRGAEDREAGVA